ncbi:MAG: hypothetical protein WB630_15740 [Candidatus Acidiferrales bacterium]
MKGKIVLEEHLTTPLNNSNAKRHQTIVTERGGGHITSSTLQMKMLRA